MKQLQSGLVWLITVIGLALTLFIFNHFVGFVERRAGVILDDPILSLFSAQNVNGFIFLLVYGGIILMVVSLWRNKPALRISVHAYIIMIWIRMLMMFLLALDPPPTPFPLRDPFVEFFGDSRQLTRDLFFSGHTATLFLFFLTSQTKIFKSIFLTAAILVACCVLLQHVHYSIDVAAAPFFAYAAYRLSRTFDDRIFLDTHVSNR